MPEYKRTYSSVLNDDPPGTGHARSTLDSAEAWQAKTEALEADDEWMQLDLGASMMVNGVATSPGNYTDSYVTTFKVSYSETGLDDEWTTYPETFEGKETGSGITQNSFSSPVLARFVRIHPKTAVGHIAMRADVLLTA